MKNLFFINRKVVAVALFFSVPVMLFSFSEKSKKHSDYQVVFINKYWNNFHLQIRVGNNSNPENNAVYYNGNLAHGYQLAVPYDVFCWYRRDANPNQPDGVHFTNWTSAGCFRNTPCTIDNP